MRAEWMLVAVMLCGCGVPTMPDGGSGRLVTFRPFKATLTSTGLSLQPEVNPDVVWNRGGNPEPPIAATADGALIFEVPEGPVLYQYGPTHYVYSSADVLEPCTPAEPTADRDAGIELELTLAQPAAVREKLTLTNSQEALFWREFTLEEGSTTFTKRVTWRSAAPLLAGPTIVAQLTEALPYDNFDRATAVGIFDAGILDPRAPGPVRGTLEPVATAGDFNIEWDGLSLSSLGSSNPRAGAFPPVVFALKGGVVIASVSTGYFRQTRVPMVMPAIEPDGLLVVGNVLAQLEPDGGPSATFLSFYAWRSPWPDAPEMKATFLPATDVRLRGGLLSWVPPVVAPQLYEVRVLERDATGGYQLVALIYTDETSLQIPLGNLERPRFEVIASYGAGLSAAKCAVFEHLESWARVPAFPTVE